MAVPPDWMPPRERLVLPASKALYVAMAGISALAAIYCIGALVGDWAPAWARGPESKAPVYMLGGVAFFGIGALYGAFQLLPGASYLALSKDGIESRSSFRSVHVPWSAIANFRWGTMPGLGMPYLACDVKDPSLLKGHVTVAMRPDLVDGANAVIPARVFGLSCEDLGTLLAAWRKHHAG